MLKLTLLKSRVRWPITTTPITKRNTVNKENILNKKTFCSHIKGFLSIKKDLLTQKKGLPTYTKETQGKWPRQIVSRQKPMANSCSKFPQKISTVNTHSNCYKYVLRSPTMLLLTHLKRSFMFYVLTYVK